jgi:hypothetical protein|nr:MAG TPA: hypothetical protein [Caudoviricetes sp.]
MEFIEKINQLKERAITLKDSLQTEEATKNALVMPFLNALGYDVFNPLEVVPEYIADSRLKKDEKVDYAIMQDNKPIILLECKKVENDKLDVKKHAGQLFKYFTASKAKFIILTNGIVYKFFSDIEEPNVLDKEPFFTFNLLEFKENQIETLVEFCKDNFNLEKAYSNAGDLKYIKQFEDVIENEYKSPSDDFVRYLISKSGVCDGRITEKLVAKHKRTTVEAFNLFMSKVMKTSLDFNLATKQEEKSNKNEIVTTVEELEGYAIVKSILSGIIDVSRVTYRDNASYFNVLLDDNIRKTICRLYFNRAQKYIAFLEGTKEVKTPIVSINEIFQFAGQIKDKVDEILALKK